MWAALKKVVAGVTDVTESLGIEIPALPVDLASLGDTAGTAAQAVSTSAAGAADTATAAAAGVTETATAIPTAVTDAAAQALPTATVTDAIPDSVK